MYIFKWMHYPFLTLSCISGPALSADYVICRAQRLYLWFYFLRSLMFQWKQERIMIIYNMDPRLWYISFKLFLFGPVLVQFFVELNHVHQNTTIGEILCFYGNQ